MTVMEALTKYVVGTAYDTLPADVIETTKKQILDTLGTAVGGSTCTISNELNDLVNLTKEWGGKKESTIIGFGGRVPAPAAAFVNGMLSVRLDFDDSHDQDRDHPSRSIIPPAFAMAERLGGINGKKFIAAVALGFDFECRIKLGLLYNAESIFTFAENTLGAACTAGKILGLDETKLANAIGIAFQHICGASVNNNLIPDNTKGMVNGLACKAGILSALFAERGFFQASNFLEKETKGNFYDIFYNGYYAPFLVTHDLGKNFRASNTSFKMYPCCQGEHSAINATLNLVNDHGIKSEQVDNVFVDMGPFDYFMVAEPLDRKQNPQNIIETQFSICWAVASAIVYGRVNIDNFSEKAFNDIRVREIASKVIPRPNPEFRRRRVVEPAVVEIRTKDGNTFSKQIHHPPGVPENPVSFEDIAAKFRQCCHYSINPISQENRESVIQMVKDLENVPDVSQIMHLLG